MKVGLVELASGCSASARARVEDLDDLVAGQLPWGRTGSGPCWSAGWSCSESTPSTLISSRSMAWQRSTLRWMDRILEPEPPGDLVLDLPVRDHRAVAEETYPAPFVADRRDLGDRHPMMNGRAHSGAGLGRPFRPRQSDRCGPGWSRDRSWAE